MTAFRYTAADDQGKDQIGVLEADSARIARQMLREQGMVPLTVEVVQGEITSGVATRRRRLSQTELAVITRQFASLVGAALPITDALTVLVEQSEQQAVRELMGAVRAEVRSGMSLSAALARHPKQFPELYRALIAAGEESGRLPGVLANLADFIEERGKLQQKIVLAFVYPAIVTVVALLVVTGLLTYVIPQVVQVFVQTKQALPFLTRMMIALSDFLRHYGWAILLVLAVTTFGIRRALQVAAIRLRWHQRILGLPILGVLSRALNTARFASTLAILVGSGVPMLRALQAAGETVSNLAMRARVIDATQRVREGDSLARALRSQDRGQNERQQNGGGKASSRLFPPVLIHLIGSGETTGTLPEMLTRAADMHAREAERRAMLLTSLLEPALILIMGVVVMVIVLAVMMPIIQINQLAR